MSQENVEITRELLDAFVRGDWDAVAAGFDPDIIIRADPVWPEQRIHGRQAAVDFGRTNRDVLGPNVQAEEMIDLGDRVLTRCWWNTRGQQSGVEGELHYTQINLYRDGRVILIEYFFETAASPNEPVQLR